MHVVELRAVDGGGRGRCRVAELLMDSSAAWCNWAINGAYELGEFGNTLGLMHHESLSTKSMRLRPAPWRHRAPP